MLQGNGWDELSRAIQEEKLKELDQYEKVASSYLRLAQETLDMFIYLSDNVRKPFLRPELINRLAAMLNYNLIQLCGPNCKNLKVQNPVKYGWNPKSLLTQIVTIYLNINCARLAKAMSEDEVSNKISHNFLLLELVTINK